MIEPDLSITYRYIHMIYVPRNRVTRDLLSFMSSRDRSCLNEPWSFYGVFVGCVASWTPVWDSFLESGDWTAFLFDLPTANHNSPLEPAIERERDWIIRNNMHMDYM